jgi:hypothetical protein
MEDKKRFRYQMVVLSLLTLATWIIVTVILG